MREVRVRLTEELAEKLAWLMAKYGLGSMEDALRFSARFTILVVERVEERKNRALMSVQR